MNRTVENAVPANNGGTAGHPRVRVLVMQRAVWENGRVAVPSGPVVLAELGPGESYIVPREYDDLPVWVETPAHFLSKTTVGIDPSVFEPSR